VAKQAAEKLFLYRKAKNRSRQEALGAIRKGRLMVLYPPIFDRSTYFRSFSAACEAMPFQNRITPQSGMRLPWRAVIDWTRRVLNDL